METIIPFVKCLVSEEEYLQSDIKESPFYQEIYVETQTGFLKHLKLSGGRSVCAPISYHDLPKDVSKVIESRQIEKGDASVNFLPSGKVPSYFMDQIIEFFREVSKQGHAELEAHAWIMWNQEKGYYIYVPEQVVSKAAVKFEYGDAVSPGNIFVVDIHSHNTMSAFYSGTDNNNDRMSINYSMVIGNLTSKTYSYVIRFNLYEQKIACTLQDVFDFDTPSMGNFVVPKEWLNQIKKPASTPSHTPARPKTGNRTYSFGAPSVRATPPSRPYSPSYSLLDMDYDADDFWKNLLKDSQYMSQFSQEEELENQYHGQYGTNEVNEAMEQISIYLEDLADSDEGLLDVIRQAYAMLGEKGRYELSMKGF